MMRFPYRLSAFAVAAMMFAQSIVLPVGARIPALAPARAPDRATAMMHVREAPAPAAKAPIRPSGGGEGMAANPAPAPHKDKTIVIDPGHGGSDPGAVHEAADGQADVTEENATFAVAYRLADLLRAEGYDVQMTRNGDASVGPDGAQRADLQARVDVANKADADLLVSVHFNGLDNHETRGTEVWYCGDRPFAAENERLAKAVEGSLVRNLRQAGYDTADRGIKDDEKMGHFAITGAHLDRPSEMPSIIGEALFMTNDQDAGQLKRPEMLDALARGYFDGIQAYFGQAQ